MKKQFRKEQRFIQRIVVRVSSLQSVIDMLRYDSCYPETQEDALKLMRLIRSNSDPKDHVISFIRAGRNNLGPTIDRWKSFNCEVLRIEHPDTPKQD